MNINEKLPETISERCVTMSLSARYHLEKILGSSLTDRVYSKIWNAYASAKKDGRIRHNLAHDTYCFSCCLNSEPALVLEIAIKNVQASVSPEIKRWCIVYVGQKTPIYSSDYLSAEDGTCHQVPGIDEIIHLMSGSPDASRHELAGIEDGAYRVGTPRAPHLKDKGDPLDKSYLDDVATAEPDWNISTRDTQKIENQEPARFQKKPESKEKLTKHAADLSENRNLHRSLEDEIVKLMEEYALKKGEDGAEVSMPLPLLGARYKERFEGTLADAVCFETGKKIKVTDYLLSLGVNFDVNNGDVRMVRPTLAEKVRTMRPCELPANFNEKAPILHQLCRDKSSSSTALEKLLTDSAINVNELFGRGRWSALHILASDGGGRSVKRKARILLEAGINPDLKTRDGWTAEEIATFYQRSALAEIISNFEKKSESIDRDSVSNETESRCLVFLSNGGTQRSRVPLPNTEDHTTEFKVWTKTPRNREKYYYRTIAGFLNSDEGGTLWIGLEDESAKVLGCEGLSTNKQQETFYNNICGVLKNRVLVGEREALKKTTDVPDYISIYYSEGPDVVCRIVVRPYKEKVYLCHKKDKAYHYYKRQGAGTSKIDSVEIKK